MTTQALGPSTLVDAVLPGRSVVRDVLVVLGFSAFVGVMAQASVRLPFTEVPITGQTFAVLLTAMALGRARGVAAVLAYLAEGAAGLPVFAEGRSGMASFVGPTGGYLVGFVLAAAVAGTLADRGWTRSYRWSFAGMLLSSAFVFLPGVVWLGVWLSRAGEFGGVGALLAAGWLPFVPGDVLKSAVAASLLPSAWRLAWRR